jgi:hypothetical protein
MDTNECQELAQDEFTALNVVMAEARAPASKEEHVSGDFVQDNE